jgi:hypothetical protein
MTIMLSCIYGLANVGLMILIMHPCFQVSNDQEDVFGHCYRCGGI